MLVKLQNGLICNNDKHFYCNDNNFMFDGINYEKDEDNGRCYRLEESCCLRTDCDGKLIRKRISRIEYFKYLDKLKAMIPTKEELRKRTGSRTGQQA